MSAYLSSKHRVQLGPRQCRRLLREWEFRYCKPRPVIARSDPLKQAAHKKLHLLTNDETVDLWAMDEELCALLLFRIEV